LEPSHETARTDFEGRSPLTSEGSELPLITKTPFDVPTTMVEEQLAMESTSLNWAMGSHSSDASV